MTSPSKWDSDVIVRLLKPCLLFRTGAGLGLRVDLPTPKPSPHNVKQNALIAPYQNAFLS